MIDKPPGPADLTVRPEVVRLYGRLTLWTNVIIQALTFIWTLPSFILVPLFTFSGGLLLAIPGVGLVLSVAIDALLWALRVSLANSSRLWQRVPVLRLPLVLLGIPLAVVGFAFVSLTPGVDYSTRYRKATIGAMCDSWPLSDIALDGAETYLRLMDRVDFEHPATMPKRTGGRGKIEREKSAARAQTAEKPKRARKTQRMRMEELEKRMEQQESVRRAWREWPGERKH